MPRAVRIRGDEPETERRAKRRNLAGEGEEEEEEEEEGTALCSTSPRSPGEPAVRTSHPEMIFAIFEPDKAESEAKQDRVCDDVAESLTEESFDPPSPPVYEPYIPDELAADPHALADLKHAKAKYKAEKARRANLFTMDHYCYEAPSCLFDDHRLLPIRQPAKDAVLLAAKSVILLSSFLGSQPLNKCNGLWFQRDEQRKTALVLTSAHLIGEKDPSVKNHWKLQWTGKYHRDAEVIVHLLDKGAAPGRLVYLQEHYEFALYEVEVDKPVQLPTFNDCVRSGQNVFRLGRDANLDLKITHGMVAYEIPSCCMPRLHLGMTFTSIKHLDPISIDRMTRNHNIESGLIVEQVSKGSHAERIGIREGDVIESFNGKYISTTIEVKIFDAIKHRRRTRNLTVIVSDRGEDIVKGAYPIMGKEAMPVSYDS